MPRSFQFTLGVDMNTFALMIILSTGIVEGAQFQSMNDCLSVQRSLKSEAFCVEKKVQDPAVEMRKMIALFKGMIKEME
jgi:hypothetical protein